ncbi:hypothetical protein GJV85_12220 [Sulfurimonas aquatica]|uniref:Uncharacterized protein n=1 Tax=Sulfurimonas aquatica TaxID=2672570 RepID=A0A975B250_9BACT|nr:hypothetical protein [Sulfurimonas aquatica]QSZ42841.1 hypothetical protein GJV85_12220 [Sulfurimonas aquatica]
MGKILLAVIFTVTLTQAWDSPLIYCKPGTHQVNIYSGKWVTDNKTGEVTYVQDKGRPIIKCVKDESKK